MKKLALLAAALLFCSPAFGQVIIQPNVTSNSPFTIVPGDNASWFAPNVLQDSGVPIGSVGGTFDGVTYCGMKPGATGNDQGAVLNTCLAKLATLYPLGATITLPGSEIDIGSTIVDTYSGMCINGSAPGSVLTDNVAGVWTNESPGTRLKWIGGNTGEMMWLETPSNATITNSGGCLNNLFFDSGHVTGTPGTGANVELEITSWRGGSFSNLFFYEPNGVGLLLDGIASNASANGLGLQNNNFYNIGGITRPTTGNTGYGTDIIAIDKPNAGNAYYDPINQTDNTDDVYYDSFFGVYCFTVKGDCVNIYGADHLYFYSLRGYSSAGNALECHGESYFTAFNCRKIFVDGAEGPYHAVQDTATITATQTSGSAVLTAASWTGDLIDGAWLTGSYVTFTGVSTGTTSLTVSNVVGTIKTGSIYTIQSSKGPASDTIPQFTTIVSQSSGTAGGAGVYVTSNATTINTHTVYAGVYVVNFAGNPAHGSGSITLSSSGYTTSGAFSDTTTTTGGGTDLTINNISQDADTSVTQDNSTVNQIFLGYNDNGQFGSVSGGVQNTSQSFFQASTIDDTGLAYNIGAQIPKFEIAGTVTRPALFGMGHFEAGDTAGSQLRGAKSRSGTTGVWTGAVSAGDHELDIEGYGDDGATLGGDESAYLSFQVGATINSVTPAVSGIVKLYTANSSGTLVQAAEWDDSQNFYIPGLAGSTKCLQVGSGGIVSAAAAACGTASGNALFSTVTGNTTNDIITMSNTTVGVQDSGTALSTLATLASPTFSGTAAFPATGLKLTSLVTGDVLSGAAGNLIEDSGTLLSSLAPKASPTFTGTASTPILSLTGALTINSWTTNGAQLKVPTSTITDNSTGASGSVTNNYDNEFAGATIAATNATVTHTNEWTLDIEPPTAGANMSIVNPYALRLGGGLYLGATAISAASWTTVGINLRGVAGTFTDTTGSGTITREVANSFGAATIATTTAGVTITNLDELYLQTPAAGSNVTATNLWSLETAGNVKFNGIINGASGITVNGAASTINKNSNFTTEIGDGSTTAAVTIGNNANVVTLAGVVQLTVADTPTAGSGASSVSGNDQKFVVTTGTAQTSITVNFGHTWAAAPVCAIGSSSTASVVDISSVSTTTITFGASVALTGATINAICF